MAQKHQMEAIRNKMDKEEKEADSEKKESGYRMKKNKEEKEGHMDKEGKVKKCATCGHALDKE